MAFTTTNPVGAVGDPTETGDITVLRDNNDWLRDTMRVQHKVPGAGSRSGRHFGVAKYAGSGTVAAGAALTAILTQVDAAFTTGLWEAIVLCNTTEIAHWIFGPSTFTSYFEIGNVPYQLAGNVYGFATSAPAGDYVKLGYDTGTTTLTLSILPPGGSDTTYKYAVWRIAA